MLRVEDRGNRSNTYGLRNHSDKFDLREGHIQNSIEETKSTRINFIDISKTMGEQLTSWDANRSSVSREISSILWNPSVHYRIHKRPPPVLTLIQINPVYVPTSNFSKIHFNIMQSSMPGSSKWHPSLRFPHQNPVPTSPLPYVLHALPISIFLI